MHNLMYKTTYMDKVIYFDPNIFEFLIPTPTVAEAQTLLQRVTKALAEENNLTAYVARIFTYPTDQEGFVARTSTYPLEVLITYADHAFERETLIMREEATDVQLEPLKYFKRLSDVPNLFTSIKAWYLKNESDYIQNIADIMAKKICHCDKLYLPESSPVTPPPLITDDIFHLQYSVIAARFDLAEHTFEHLLQSGIQQSRAMIQESQDIYKRYVSAVEHDLAQLQNDGNIQRHESVKTYASYLTSQLITPFISLKVDLLSALNDADSKISRRIEFLRETTRHLKNAVCDDNYGYSIAQVNYIKHELIQSLYQIALCFLQEHWRIAERLNDKHQAAHYRREKIALINHEFAQIIHFDILCRPSALAKTLARLSSLSFTELTKITENLLNYVNTNYFSNSETLNHAIMIFKNANERVNKVAHFSPYHLGTSILNKTNFNLDAAIMPLEKKAKQLIQHAQQTIESIQKKHNANTEVLTLLDDNLKNNFDQLLIRATQSVTALSHFQVLITAKLQCDEWLTRSCDDTEIEDLYLMQLPMQDFFMQIIGDQDTEATREITAIVMNAMTDLRQLLSTLNTAVNKVKAKQQSLVNVYHNLSNDTVISNNTLLETIESVNEIQQHLLGIDTLKARYLREKNQLSNLLEAPLHCKNILDALKNAAHAPAQTEEALYHPHPQEPFEKAQQALQQLETLRHTIAHCQPKALQLLVNEHIDQCKQTIVNQQKHLRTPHHHIPRQIASHQAIQPYRAMAQFFHKHRKSIILASVIIGTVAVGACTLGLLSLFGIFGGLSVGTATFIASSHAIGQSMGHALIVGGATTASMALGTGMVTGIMHKRAFNKEMTSASPPKSSSTWLMKILGPTHTMPNMFQQLGTRRSASYITNTVRASITFMPTPKDTDERAPKTPRMRK